MSSARASSTPVYVTHQSLGEHLGGASAVTAWVVQALCRDFDVRLATPDHCADLSAIDAVYGTSLRHSPVTLHTLSVPRWLHRVPPSHLKSLRLAASFRDPALRQGGSGLVFNTANEMSFPWPSVNYVHCPIRHTRMVAELYGGTERWLRLANNSLFKVVSGFDEAAFRRGVCLTNSQWTASALRRTYGVQARVIYPPVTLQTGSALRWDERSCGFVCLGRIAADKRTHEAIEVVGELRRHGHDAHLHIVGSGSTAYARQVLAAAKHRPYVRFHHNMPRAELSRLLGEHKFGLHMMRNEHFGMAVAEMAAAGMLVLAHRSAGPMEILGEKSRLLFTGTQNAISTARRLLENPGLQLEMVDGISARGVRESFSPETFMREVRDTVAAALRLPAGERCSR